jgi:DNA-binding response OmpR family regulator
MEKNTMRVLIADTSETSLEILQSFLSNNGCETEIASDGLECIALMREFRPHVLVLGAGLLWGGSDGLLELLQEDRQFCDIHLILSAFSPEEFDDIPLSRHFAWLPKPFRLADLLRQLDVLEAIADSSFELEVDEFVAVEFRPRRNELTMNT